jgi:5-methyltetrahydropteroyltriglutamate--homocysteine methyltransferase
MQPYPLFPVTVVGSFPRSQAVLKAQRKRQRGNIDAVEYEQITNEAVIETLRLQEAAGLDIVTDGEQRRDNFYSFITEHIAGIRLMTLAELLDYVDDKAAFERLLNALDVPAFALKNPVVTGKLKRTSPLVVNDYQFARAHTTKPIKVTLPGPYLLTRSMWVKSLSAGTYPDKESLGSDVVAILRAELTELAAAGCTFVQFDEPVLSEVALAGPHETHSFMCAALSKKSSPEEELSFAVELINQVVAGISGQVKTALHVCRGNWSQREDVLLAGPYNLLIPYFSRMSVNQFVLEYATERAGSLDVLADLPEDKEIGLGVVDPRTARVESVEFILNRVHTLLSYRRPEQIFLNPDCGFGTFADRPVNTNQIAAQKLEMIHKAAEALRRECGKND